MLMAPLTRLGAALKKWEDSDAGVYLLFGEDDEGPLAYIGKGEDIGGRIKSHDYFQGLVDHCDPYNGGQQYAEVELLSL